jgi:hypothetical protein
MEINCDKSKEPYGIVAMRPFRKTSKVWFDLVPMEIFPRIDAIDRVIHESGALSPGTVAGVERPWYMHSYQEDHLLVLHGAREVELYWPAYGKADKFHITAGKIEKNGNLFYDGPAMLAWGRGVFHRIKSDESLGSASLNIAVRGEAFDIKTNFNIYDLDTATGEYKVVREGHLDQH